MRSQANLPTATTHCSAGVVDACEDCVPDILLSPSIGVDAPSMDSGVALVMFLAIQPADDEVECASETLSSG
jgi:hypothetical protein